MATKIYETEIIKTIDGIDIEISPLKIKYLRQFMDIFMTVYEEGKKAKFIDILCECILITMKQFYPSINTLEQVEDSFDMKTIYKIVDIGANIQLDKQQSADDVVPEIQEDSSDKESSSWDSLDLTKLEAEVFLLGIWKNYDELETHMCIAELLATIQEKRELDSNEKKFLAAMQGVDLDEGNVTQEDDPWEAMKNRVAAKASGIEIIDSNDITSFQGSKAQQAGFGIGMGLDYQVIE